MTLLFSSSCSLWRTENENPQPLNQKQLNAKKVYEIENVKLTCDGSHCESWEKWLAELLIKKKKLKIPKTFYKNAPHGTHRAKNFSDFLNLQNKLEIQYSDFHCLEEQLSCTIDGEEGIIFFNSRSLALSKEEWLGVIWHELFHLNYPSIPHISCTTCADKKSQVSGDCDINSFSSYGFERLWHQTHSFKFSSDKKSKKKNKIILNSLNKRICN